VAPAVYSYVTNNNNTHRLNQFSRWLYKLVLRSLTASLVSVQTSGSGDENIHPVFLPFETTQLEKPLAGSGLAYLCGRLKRPRIAFDRPRTPDRSNAINCTGQGKGRQLKNPLDTLQEGLEPHAELERKWKRQLLKDTIKSLGFLQNYKWHLQPQSAN
jgi:hypothetical protein